MATDKDFTAQDWQRIEAAPYIAVLAISDGDPSSRKGIADEAGATGEAIRAGASSSSEIVRTLAARCAQGDRPLMPKIPKDPARGQNALVEACKSAADLVAARAPVEADAYSRFLLDVARAAARASRESGGVEVAILALALGLPGPSETQPS